MVYSETKKLVTFSNIERKNNSSCSVMIAGVIKLTSFVLFHVFRFFFYRYAVCVDNTQEDIREFSFSRKKNSLFNKQMAENNEFYDVKESIDALCIQMNVVSDKLSPIMIIEITSDDAADDKSRKFTNEMVCSV